MTGGTLPAWYNLSAPVTFFLEPGLFSDQVMRRVWNEAAPEGETEMDKIDRVDEALRAFYTSSGYQLWKPRDVDQDHNLSAMGRVVHPGEFVRNDEVDRLLGSWVNGRWT